MSATSETAPGSLKNDTEQQSTSVKQSTEKGEPSEKIPEEICAKDEKELHTSSPEELSSKLAKQTTENIDSIEIVETSSQNKKALDFLTSAESKEEEAEENELNAEKITNQVMNILNEGRIDTELNKAQLLTKSEDLQHFISKLVAMLAHKTEFCFKLERQNFALIEQAKTLKNVIGITKDLLGLRNMEVEHLQADLKLMEDNISAERTRHNILLQKLSEAMNLNEQLKNEYLTQSGLFQSLREKYHEKIALLTTENQRLMNLLTENKEEINLENCELNSSTEVIEK